MSDEPFSLLMAVHVAERPAYLDAALRSVWDEQSLKPDQVVLVKDGQLTAELEDVVAAWLARLGGSMDVVPLDTNQGLATALNAGLPLCRYELVARMDSNDISLPDRFARQVAFMAAHPDIAVSSGQIEEWDESMTHRVGERCLPQVHDEIFRMARSRNPINHPAAIYRKTTVLAVGGYPKIFPEDYPLWCLMLMRGDRFANLGDWLLRMRTGGDFLQRRGRSFLEGEVAILKLQRRIGMLNDVEYARNFAMRQILRRSPIWLRRRLYRFARR